MGSAAPMQQANTETLAKNMEKSMQMVSQNRQTSSTEHADLRPQTTTQRQLQGVANKSIQSQQFKTAQRMAEHSVRAVQLNNMSTMMHAPSVQKVEDEEALQAKAFDSPTQRKTTTDAPQTSKRNNTGLPDNLKSGIESLSGMSMDHVKVHYNSSQPAQLNAHAYAQGSEIHVAPGQEQHLPHEAWHVVQQAQGRVKPTMQMKAGVPVNDDAGLESEADVMGIKALNFSSAENAQNRQTSSPSSENIAQLARLYDETLSSQKADLMSWMVEENQTLGLNAVGTSDNANANKKSNFSWHHILAFADLAQHGEGKTNPANHGGNVRLGPMKNRYESSDVSGGTAIDYSYLPLNENGEIVLDRYSQGIFDETIKANDESSLRADLPSQTYNETPQTAMFTQGKKANAFAEWFFESQAKTEMLTKEAISEKVAGAESGAINTFVSAINKQFDSLLRTYKYYNKRGEVQTTSGVPMTDISEGNFGHIVISGGTLPKAVKASTVIDSLLSDKKWIKRGSQGQILDNSTTYKFGIAKNPLFITLVESVAAQIDLASYKQLKLDEFEENVQEEFEKLHDVVTQSDEFSQDKENDLIGALVENMKNGVASYDELWNGVDESAVEDQYVKVKVDEDTTYWPFPVPEADTRESTLHTKITIEQASEAWTALFVKGLTSWDGETPLFEEGTNASDGMYIDFEDAKTSIADNEQKWDIKNVNRERRNNSAALLPPKFLTTKTTITQVENAVADKIDSDAGAYTSSLKESMPLSDIKAELRGKLSGHFNVSFKRLKGVTKDLTARKQAFGEHFAGFVQTTIWNVINSSKIPTDTEGTEGKKWDELGDAQVTLYETWLEREDIATKVGNAATSIKLTATLP